MTMARRQLRFGAFFSVPGCHPTGWRHPDAICETDLDFRYLADMARMAERGKLDCMFFQDSVAIPGSTAVYGGKPFRTKNGRQAHIEPVSAIAALAAITTRIGLVSTCTTSYNEPYNVARRFLTIDHISGGRAGWNLVTSQAEDEAVNFGRDQHFEHGIRYDRAAEFHDVVVGLWDSWEDDAFLRDKESGVWFDFDKMHILRHEGQYFNVRGPLNVARSPQGRPVVAQAGSSDIGMELAARTADMVFTAQTTIKEGQDFCNDMRSRVVNYGRGPEDIRIFPGIMPIVGRTETEAREKYEELRSLADDMQAWLEAGACDGFNLLFPYYPKPLEEWVTMVVPELQRRGIFRTEYEGKTFRENLGVPIPPNIHTANRTSVQVKRAVAADD